MVDVDGVLPMLVAEILGEDLHVSRQHDEVNRLLLEDFLDLPFETSQQGIIRPVRYSMNPVHTRTQEKKNSLHSINSKMT